MAIGYALRDMHKQFKECFNHTNLNANSDSVEKNDTTNTTKCPDCGEELVFEGGCNICKSCGWSKCD